MIIAQFDLKKYDEVFHSIQKFKKIPSDFNIKSYQLLIISFV